MTRVKQFKPQIRLPDDEGPNPYDSKTRPEDLPPKDWQIVGRGWGWWFAIIAMGVGMVLIRYWNGGL